MSNRTARLAINIINYFVVPTVLVSNIILPGRTEAQDNPAIKDGNPCIEEICINDEVKNLPRLNWRKVAIPRESYESQLKAIGNPSSVKLFSRYWAVGRVDGIGLQALSKVKGFCTNSIKTSPQLAGEYSNKEGKPVLVSFSVVPSEDGKSQKFVVTRILKFIFKGKLTPEQYDDLTKQAEEKYGSLVKQPNKSPRYPNVSINSALGDGAFLQIESQFDQLNPPDGVPINPSKFQYFPGCGGDRKIKL